jgi:hypothetical protein
MSTEQTSPPCAKTAVERGRVLPEQISKNIRDGNCDSFGMDAMLLCIVAASPV